MKELFEKVSQWLIASWDKIATLAGSAGLGAGTMFVVGDGTEWIAGGVAGLVGRLLAHVQIRL
jgi:hypothetical protein